MEWARKHGCIVFTHDLDFGAILALTRAPDVLPSDTRADRQARRCDGRRFGPPRIARGFGVESMIEYEIGSDVTNEALNALFADAWRDHAPRDFSAVLSQNLCHVCAVADGVLVGFVNVAWDGDKHAFLLDPTVHSDFQRQGIGTHLVRHATDVARSKGVEWLHVDYEPRLSGFYARCGFGTTEAGLMSLNEGKG